MKKKGELSNIAQGGGMLRGGKGRRTSTMVPEGPRGAAAPDEAPGGLANPSGLVLRLGLTSLHAPDCGCTQCVRRKQLLLWRDSMIDAQRIVESETSRAAAAGLTTAQSMSALVR